MKKGGIFRRKSSRSVSYDERSPDPSVMGLEDVFANTDKINFVKTVLGKLDELDHGIRAALQSMSGHPDKRSLEQLHFKYDSMMSGYAEFNKALHKELSHATVKIGHDFAILSPGGIRIATEERDLDPSVARLEHVFSSEGDVGLVRGLLGRLDELGLSIKAEAGLAKQRDSEGSYGQLMSEYEELYKSIQDKIAKAAQNVGRHFAIVSPAGARIDSQPSLSRSPRAQSGGYAGLSDQSRPGLKALSYKRPLPPTPHAKSRAAAALSDPNPSGLRTVGGAMAARRARSDNPSYQLGENGEVYKGSASPYAQIDNVTFLSSTRGRAQGARSAVGEGSDFTGLDTERMSVSEGRNTGLRVARKAGLLSPGQRPALNPPDLSQATRRAVESAYGPGHDFLGGDSNEYEDLDRLDYERFNPYSSVSDYGEYEALGPEGHLYYDIDLKAEGRDASEYESLEPVYTDARSLDQSGLSSGGDSRSEYANLIESTEDLNLSPESSSRSPVEQSSEGGLPPPRPPRRSTIRRVSEGEYSNLPSGRGSRGSSGGGRMDL